MNKEQFKEWFDECMEEREKLESGGHTIHIDSSSNKSKAMEILMHMKYRFSSTKENRLHINGIQKKALDDARINYVEE